MLVVFASHMFPGDRAVKYRIVTSLVASCVAMGGAPAHAQADQTGGLEEVVVTAQRRVERAQDVPIPISVFSAEQLASKGVSNTLDIAQFVPNVIAMNNTGLGSANAFYMRGLGNTETIPTFDPPVGVYVDDIYLSRQNANNLSMFDVERVEVLRGPQGTLFGRNTTGGAISVVMSQPEYGQFDGSVEIGYGENDKKLARANFDIPIGQSFAMSLGAYWQEDDGYVKNTTTGDTLNDDDGWGARIGLRTEIGSRASWRGSYARIESDGENVVNFECDPRNPTVCSDRYVTTGYREGGSAPTSPFAPLVIGGRKAFYELGSHVQTDLVTSKFTVELGEATTLDFITGWVETAHQYGLDFYDGRSAPTISAPFPAVTGNTRGGFVILNDSRSKQFSQEIKLNGSLFDERVSYVTGLYYIDEDIDTDFADVFSVSPAVALLLADRVLSNGTEAYAGYLQADYHFSDRWMFTAGVRYTDEEKYIGFHDNRPTCQVSPLPATCLDTRNLVSVNGTPIPTKLETQIWTPRFALNFKPTDDLLLFASATRGFKSGGWNARATSPATALPFDPEKLWSYELGTKSEWFDHRLRANVTIFYSDVSDLQTPSAAVTPTGATTFITRNFADYENKGVEVELAFVPMEDMNLYASIGYQDDRYVIDRNAQEFDEYGTRAVWSQQAQCQAALAAGNIPLGPNTAACGAGIVTPTGEIAEPVRTPEFTIALGGDYTFRLGDFALVPSINAIWHSDQEIQTSNVTIYTGSVTGTNGTFPANPFDGDFIVGSKSDAVWLFNAGIALRSPGDRWQVAASCSNCSDEAWVQSYLGWSYINPPRTWLVSARYNF